MPAQPKLLVIDDDRTTRALLTRQLDEAGYDVHDAPDGAEGLSLTRNMRPDLVLCDWVMPRLDGIQYCRTVKADPELRATHVTLLSARSDCDDKVQGLDAGADDFLTKPLEDDELLARVRAGLRRRVLQAELAAAEHRSALVEMATTLGHEINNPLTALFGHMELVMHYLEEGDTPRVQHHLRQAGDVSNRIADVARRLASLREPRTTTYLGELLMLDLEKV